jgi:subtilisin family serine protease
MRFKHTRTFAAVAMVLSAAVATNTNAVRPEAVADGATLITPAFTPVGLDKRPINVMVQLGDDPVALKQEAAGRKLSKAEKDAAKNALKGPQNALISQIQALGGTVINTYQSSYNGIKVRIARDKAAQLAGLPGVTGVRQLAIMRPSNTNGVPLVGGPSVWGNLGLHGENVKVAIIDTGIDYTHANFGGPGTVAAYNSAFATNTAAANPAWFGPAAPRVKGGIDLVGDDYNADPDSATFQPIPHPDPNPLDCVHTSGSVGHGSHVAGSAAGSGVLANGKTYAGPYNATTISGNSWIVGPGVAPKADVYSIRVFGCDGSTDVTVDAIEWAVDNDMDVINMSLGSSFGTNEDPSAVATTNAAKAGVVVVTSAGNSGASQYITGSPGTADGAISTAANDPLQLVPGIRINTTPPTGTPLSLQAVNANGVTAGLPLSGPLVVLKDNPATTSDIPGFIGSADESLGCHPSAYTFNGIVPGGGQISVAKRGACARVAKAIFAQQAGAAVAVMTNNAAGLPPVEGPITVNPDNGVPFTVTIPFAGVAGNQASATSDSGKLQASPVGTTAALSVQNFPNPAFSAFASFSSGGPRTGDSALKPDITGPGLSIFSTASGTGNGGKFLSGTSMASPHVAGVAALTRQAHPTWSVQDIKSAIVNTGLPSGVLDYRTSRGGTGLAQAPMSTKSQVVASADDKKFTVGINFGYEELTDDFSKKKKIKLHNNGSTDATFTIAPANQAGSPHTVNLNKTVVTVKAGKDADVDVTLNVAVATAGDASAFREVAGLVQFTPATAADNGGVVLRVPYYLVPRATSDINTKLDKFEGTDPSSIAEVTNKKGAVAGNADFYAWGLEDKKDKGKVSNDIRAVGVQSLRFPERPGRSEPRTDRLRRQHLRPLVRTLRSTEFRHQ